MDYQSAIINSFSYGNQIKFLNTKFSDIKIQSNQPLFYLEKTTLE